MSGQGGEFDAPSPARAATWAPAANYDYKRKTTVPKRGVSDGKSKRGAATAIK